MFFFISPQNWDVFCYRKFCLLVSAGGERINSGGRLAAPDITPNNSFDPNTIFNLSLTSLSHRLPEEATY
jgi:hypothetical protein